MELLTGESIPTIKHVSESKTQINQLESVAMIYCCCITNKFPIKTVLVSHKLRFILVNLNELFLKTARLEKCTDFNFSAS